jgi:V/A-type H+-transporting ATPase subunit E
MAEELQHLIDRIHREAIDKAEKEAGLILAQAKEKAAALVKEAEAQAAARLEKADRDSQVFVERSARTLEQAARDLLITVGQGIEHIVQDIVGDATGQALGTDTLQQMMLKIAQAYAEKAGAESRIEFLIGEKDQAAVVKYFANQYRHHLVKGLTIRTDNGVLKGFRVMLKDEQVSHDFTQPAIAEALANFLRPHLAEVVHRAARGTSNGKPA